MIRKISPTIQGPVTSNNRFPVMKPHWLTGATLWMCPIPDMDRNCDVITSMGMKTPPA